MRKTFVITAIVIAVVGALFVTGFLTPLASGIGAGLWRPRIIGSVILFIALIFLIFGLVAKE